MELEVTQAYPTAIGQLHVPDAGAMNQDLRTTILAEEVNQVSLGRSNIGGWHSRPDFLNRSEPSVDALSQWITWAVRKMIAATAGGDEIKGILSVSAWRRSVARERTMRRILIRTAHGPACTT